LCALGPSVCSGKKGTGESGLVGKRKTVEVGYKVTVGGLPANTSNRSDAENQEGKTRSPFLGDGVDGRVWNGLHT